MFDDNSFHAKNKINKESIEFLPLLMVWHLKQVIKFLMQKSRKVQCYITGVTRLTGFNRLTGATLRGSLTGGM